MAETKIIKLSLENGVGEARLESWTQFNEVVYRFLDFPHYIFRGHRKETWKLEPTLDRTLRKPEHYDRLMKKQLDNFKYSARGRRGTNPPKLDDDNDWWSLGRHRGLNTPLLDWTESPYVALFFAFAKPLPQKYDTDFRVVFALDRRMVKIKCKKMSRDPSKLKEIIEFIELMSDDNPRLVNQVGLFTKIPDNVDLQSWVQKHCKGVNKNILAKIYIPNIDREECLKALNKMNKNYSTLFPDLEGSALHTNLKLEIPNY